MTFDAAGGSDDYDSLREYWHAAMVDSDSYSNSRFIERLSCAETAIEVSFEFVQEATRRVSNFATF